MSDSNNMSAEQLNTNGSSNAAASPQQQQPTAQQIDHRAVYRDMIRISADDVLCEDDTNIVCLGY